MSIDRYQALALQTRCDAVNNMGKADARSAMLEAITAKIPPLRDDVASATVGAPCPPDPDPVPRVDTGGTLDAPLGRGGTPTEPDGDPVGEISGRASRRSQSATSSRPWP